MGPLPSLRRFYNSCTHCCSTGPLLIFLRGHGTNKLHSWLHLWKQAVLKLQSCSKHLHALSSTGQLDLLLHHHCLSFLCGCVPFLFPAQASCVAVFPSYSLLKLLVWLCSLPIPCSSSLCGCVPFLFPSQAPCVAMFTS